MIIKRKKICIISTVTYPLNVFMRSHIKSLSFDFDVTLIANGNASDFAGILNENIKFINLPIARKISIFNDFSVLISLYRIMAAQRFDVVHSLMPKTSLLGMFAAFLARVPIRLHMFTGQVWANYTGAPRFLFKTIDKLVVRCATHLLADSASQRQFLIDQKIVQAKKIHVLGEGSVCGVNTSRFKPDLNARQSIRSHFKLTDQSVVFLFLGRINHDKGVLDLAHAFMSVASKNSNAHLLVVGPDESNVCIEVAQILSTVAAQYHRVDFTKTPELYMAAADVFCLPSYREGFGSVLIEAAACGLPTIASKIYGITDAVIDGETGLLHPPKDISQIQFAMTQFFNSPELRAQMGNAGMQRAINKFSTQNLVLEMRAFYSKIIGEKC